MHPLYGCLVLKECAWRRLLHACASAPVANSLPSLFLNVIDMHHALYIRFLMGGNCTYACAPSVHMPLPLVSIRPLYPTRAQPARFVGSSTESCLHISISHSVSFRLLMISCTLLYSQCSPGFCYPTLSAGNNVHTQRGMRFEWQVVIQPETQPLVRIPEITIFCIILGDYSTFLVVVKEDRSVGHALERKRRSFFSRFIKPSSMDPVRRSASSKSSNSPKPEHSQHAQPVRQVVGSLRTHRVPPTILEKLSLIPEGESIYCVGVPVVKPSLWLMVVAILELTVHCPARTEKARSGQNH